MKGVRLVTLDMVGTVFRFSQPPAMKYQEVAARHGHDFRLEDLASSFNFQWRQMNLKFPHFGSTTPGLTSTMWWHQLVKETFRTVLGADYDDKKFSLVASELFSYYNSATPYVLAPDAVMTLAELRSRNISVGAISNFDNRLHHILPSLGIAQFLQFVVTSEDAKVSKPEPEIFNFAARKCCLSKLEPGEILHIGDDITNDYEAPRQLGWQSLLLDGRGGGEASVPPQHVVSSLSEILEL